MSTTLTMLSPHFSLAELTRSETAAKLGLDNTPPADVLPRLRQVAEALEVVRALLGGAPIQVNSGYRSPAVNAAVGSKPTSGHVLGWAVDFVAPKFGSPLAICRLLAGTPTVHFDQLIEEGTWVHLSVDPRGRREVLTMRSGQYRQGLGVKA